MKAITVLEPWASLIACGAKKIETRSWSTKYRGRIAIHAAASDRHYPLCYGEPFLTALEQFSKAVDIGGAVEAEYEDRIELEYGKVIAIADLVDCIEVTAAIFDIRTGIHHGAVIGKKSTLREIRGDEYTFGNYPVGGYAWILDNIQRIEPIPAKGQQRIWNLNVPAVELAAWHSEFPGGKGK